MHATTRTYVLADALGALVGEPADRARAFVREHYAESVTTLVQEARAMARRGDYLRDVTDAMERALVAAYGSRERAMEMEALAMRERQARLDALKGQG